MGWTMWVFQYKNDNWTRVTLKWYERFFEGKSPASEPEGTILKFALVGIELDDREPEKANYPSFVVHEVAAGGFINLDRLDRVKRTGLVMALGEVLNDPGEGNVIAASSKFAKREYDHLARWTPTHEQNQALLHALRSLGVPC